MSAEDALADWPEAAGMALAPLPGGRINDTFIVGERVYVLQRINRHVFADPSAVMRNLAAICPYDHRIVAPLATAAGPLAATVDGETWRLFPYIGGSVSLERLPPRLVGPAAQAFGQFQAALTHFPGRLEPVIPGFHDLPGYLEALWRAAAVGGASAELEYVRRHRPFEFDDMRAVIHGDCKVNNLLFDASEQRVLRLIDLDTAMHGHPAWDFGDLVRSVASGADERGRFDLSVETFRDLAAGFARGAGGIRDPAAFAAAPGHMCFMLGVRFLADWLQGNRYFRVSHPDDNLHRARSQLQGARRCDALQDEFLRVLRRT